MGFFGIFFIVPMVLFVIFVAPIWLVLHYRSNRQLGAGLDEPDRVRLTALVAQAELLQQRVHTLERLLDVENPQWRSTNTEPLQGGADHE